MDKNSKTKDNMSCQSSKMSWTNIMVLQNNKLDIWQMIIFYTKVWNALNKIKYKMWVLEKRN